jgi:hypothetical protein
VFLHSLLELIARTVSPPPRHRKINLEQTDLGARTSLRHIRRDGADARVH